MAVKNGWLFIYLKNPKILAEVLRITQTIDKSGHGVIVFVEDIDQVTKGERNDALQDILNTIDGGDTKNTNIISLFTTNHIEKIEPTFLRGKRIGSVISMGGLDEKTALEFINLSFQGSGFTLADDLSEVCKKVSENNIVPAFMAEIIDSVKANMVMREDKFVKNEYFLYSIESYLKQVELAKTKDSSLTPEMMLAQSLKQILKVEQIETNTIVSGLGTLHDNFNDIGKRKIKIAIKRIKEQGTEIFEETKRLSDN